MLVPADVWPWLRAEAGLDGGKPARGGMVELPAAVGDAIMSGQVVAKILAGRVAELGDPGGNPTAEARLLKQVAAQRSAGPGGGAAPSERLYSWNLLSPVLARLRVGLSDVPPPGRARARAGRVLSAPLRQETGARHPSSSARRGGSAPSRAS